MSFKDNVVIVTGASSGIGAAAALKFAEEGANVVIVARNKEKLTAVAEKCAENGTKPLVIVADLATDTCIKEIIDTTLTQFGKLNVLVNNAGICGFVDIVSDNIMKKFDEIIATNLRAAAYLTNLSMPHLIKSRGNVVNISGVAAHAVLFPGNLAYCTSKAALDHFTRGVALDVASHGVRLNSICPGPVKSDYMDTLIPDKTKHKDFWDTLSKRTALGKLIEPKEVADLILYLASDKARSITGSSFVIDGGMLLKG
ncbi:3-oxoacyl-[acyl-carrier-protein] reductase FabG-like [Maniola jurtina]|uniref:3-oxoacyl-[acyl-carrier-protein] reductase FabG-like n=1 Tax=Maniola jurtina TaxID=191418 RepID=UPI001E689EF5|nr:3-oxoacyl-[acyl-carrier-protein] reductase FabG-like [Maniola jurtina]